MMKNKLRVLLLVLLAALNMGFAQKRGKMHDAGMIIAQTVKEFQGIQDFTVTIEAEVNMERVQIPKMSALMYFKKPDKIHFSSEGFLLVPRDGIALNPEYLWERYDATFVQEDSISGSKYFELQLAAKEKITKLRQLYVWVDPVRWTIAKIETVPYEGRTLSMAFTYERQAGKYWLPSQLIVSFGSTTEDRTMSVDSSSQAGNQFDQQQRGGPRRGMVTIQYSNYKVNTGIDDAVFEKKDK